MRLSRSLRWIFVALLLSLVPVASQAGVFISVGIAPPPLAVYDQPPCPQPGLMWTPGYWAYGPDGYYWVPGAWVPSPYAGALWTPPYWGWSGGLYVFHPGYWGPHVGYYGGVNYGFGYLGIGFVGGVWHGGVFAYNTAVVHVNNVVIHNTYVDRTVIVNHTVINNNHVSYNGGPGGINHQPMPEERAAMNEHHVAATSFQSQHEQVARGDHNAYFNNNHGRPENAAMARPMTNNHPATNNFNNNHGNFNAPQNNRPQPQERNNQQQPHNESRPAPQEHQSRPQESHPEHGGKEPHGR